MGTQELTELPQSEIQGLEQISSVGRNIITTLEAENTTLKAQVKRFQSNEEPMAQFFLDQTYDSLNNNDYNKTPIQV